MPRLPSAANSCIRTAAVADVPAMASLVSAYWQFEGIESVAAATVAGQLQRLIEDERLGAAWVAEVDGCLVGYLLAVYVFSLEHGGLTAEIDELYVAPQRRGGRLGAALLAAAERGAMQAGCTNLSLQLARGNNAARAFYRRQGFVERAGYELMEKTLTEESHSPRPGEFDDAGNPSDSTS
ncbi:MAG TPA: GNAT family N-acetyltransferase [Lacipirellulaceae bacterium]|nr:GNAT family N-acetyltransferase [Lacipirellulaceae bacterium]